MITLSSHILGAEPYDPEERAARLLQFEVTAFELGARTHPEEIAILGREILGAGRQIVSLENYCPAPAAYARPGRPIAGSVDGRVISLAALDPEERRAGVAATVTTLEWAARFEAATVIVSGGVIALTESLPPPATARVTRELERKQRSFLEARAGGAPRHLDALRHSLDAILESADRLEVTVALSTPPAPHHLPDVGETLALLQEFRGAPLGVWLDPAHLVRRARLGEKTAPEVAAALLPHALGIHVHDLDGVVAGLPPGMGDLTEEERTTHPEGVPRVLRCAPGTPDDAIANALEHLGDDPRDDHDGIGPAIPIIGGG